MSILYMLENASYREALIDSLCGDKTTSELRDIIEYVIEYKLSIFSEYDKPLYKGDDSLLFLVLPSIKRLWLCTYIEPPTLLKGSNLELYKLMFNIDEFIDDFILILNSDVSIEPFEYLNRSSELVRLVVDNYIGKNFQKAYNSKSVDIDILKYKRELRINKVIK